MTTTNTRVMETIADLTRERVLGVAGWIGIAILTAGMVTGIWALWVVGTTLAAVGLVSTLYYYVADRE